MMACSVSRYGNVRSKSMQELDGTDFCIKRTRVQLVQQCWECVWCEFRCTRNAVLEAVFQILSSNPERVSGWWFECDGKVVEHRFKHVLRLSVCINGSGGKAGPTCALGPRFHSVMGTCRMEKTIMRFRGSFSPSKYDMKLATKSLSPSGSTEMAERLSAGRSLGTVGEHTLSIFR